MFQSELFVKFRAYFLFSILLITFPIPLIFAWIHKAFELCFFQRKFKNINGEVAVVTGGGNGLGREIALQLAKRGCKIAIADIDVNGAEKTVEIIKSKYNTECKAYKVNITNFEGVEDLNKKILIDLGVATILINNAGVLKLSNFAKPKPAEIQHLINVNLVAHFWTIKVFLKNMKKEQKGHIVAISSIAGVTPLVFNMPYAASKFGIRGMMRTLRLDLKAQGYNNIFSTNVCPFFLTTNSEVEHDTNLAGIGNFFPLIKGENAAKSIVHAMLRNEKEIILPRIFAIIFRILDAFPSAYQDILYCLLTNSFIKKFLKIYERDEKLAEAELK